MATSAQMMEQELQHSVLISQQASDLDMDEADLDAIAHNQDSAAANHHINADAEDLPDAATDHDIEIDADGEAEEDDAPGEPDSDVDNDENASDEDSDDDADADGEDDDDAFDEAEEGFEEEEEDGEDEAEVASKPRASSRRMRGKIDAGVDEDDEEEDDSEDDAADEDDEGVGAVKIRPGETDDEEEEDSEPSEESGSLASGHESEEDDEDEESDAAEVWEEKAEVEEEEEEEESDNAHSNVCIFCKQDEENDPSEDFEAFLNCTDCGRSSHQQCARENDAFHDTKSWKCPTCIAESEHDSDGNDGEAQEGTEELVDLPDGISENDGSAAPKRRSRSSREDPSLAGSSSKGPSRSASNGVDEDSVDGSRSLRRKRKATPAEETSDNVITLRKRRRNTADGLSIKKTASADESSRPPSSARPARLKANTTGATIMKKTKGSLLVKFRVNMSELTNILSKKPAGVLKGRKKGRPPKAGGFRRTNNAAVPATAPFMSTSYSQPFYSFFDRETDELKGKPYGGILTEAEADTSKTLPTTDDRRRFDESKQKAEEEWRQRILTMQAEAPPPPKRPKKSAGPASQIECIEFGGWEIDTWYAAPYPEEYSRNRVLYICEFCLKYMNSDYVAWRHKMKCPAKHPPGDEIYRHGSVSVFEVDGRKNPVYCQNLCLLAKLFLGSKTLYYDVEPFLFYVLCEYDDLGYHFVGYFSKEKRASSQNNVSCILTLPIHQRKGYGNLLIDFSYLLTRVEEKTGSPEKPLSDMGLVSYRNYWRLVMCRYLLNQMSEGVAGKTGLSIKSISTDTGLTPDDVISALEGLRCLVRDPQTGLYAFRVDLPYCREYVAKWEAKGYVSLNPEALAWTPYVMGRTNAANFELAPALTAIAPREEEDVPKVVEIQLPTADGVATLVTDQPGETQVEAEVEAAVNGFEDPRVEPEQIVESTETVDANADVPVLATDDAGADGDQPAEVTGPGAESQDSQAHDWTEPYKSIPPSRFVVFPPISARRVERPRVTAARTPLARPPSGRPRGRRSLGGVRRPSGRPKSSSTRRKTGGTGRGPGRWPKGTKKSDYGNADSGPGLPPGWIKEPKDAASALLRANKDNDQIQYTNGTDTESLTPDKRSGVNGMKKASPSAGSDGIVNVVSDLMDVDGEAEEDDDE